MKNNIFAFVAVLGFFFVCLFVTVCVYAQYGTFSKEERIEWTPKNPYERFADGRPKVPDEIIRRMKEVSTEEAWGVLQGHGYQFQFESNWMNPFPDRALTGRAVTASFMPLRPDVNDLINDKGKKEGQVGAQNSWVIDTVVENDVLVVDILGKIEEGWTFAGDNLANSIYAKSKTGFVINGGVRDLEGIMRIPGISIFVRGADPVGIGGVMLMGINIPVRIGRATVMPGDIVLGRREGIIFIPPQFAEEVVKTSEKVRLIDRFGHQRLQEKKYTPGQIDSKWTPEIEKDFEQWKKDQGIKE